MSVKFYSSLLVCTLLTIQTVFGQTVKTVGASGADYPNLSSAFQAVNSGTLTGNIEFQITSSITEPAGKGAMLVGNGEVGWVDITAFGTGYKPGDSVYFSDPGPGGRRARGFVQHTGSATGAFVPGGVKEVYITDPGSGYTSAPTITFGGTGSGAAGTALIGGNYQSITIYPTGSGYIISSNTELSTIDLLGADNVTIDGRVNRTGSLADLTIVNSNSSPSIRYNMDRLHALALSADATNNQFSYVIFKSAAASAVAATQLGGGNRRFFACVHFGRGIFQGNSNNIIENCKITKNGATGVIGLVSDGWPSVVNLYEQNQFIPTSGRHPQGYPNASNIIRNNDFFDLVKQGTTFLDIATNSEGWLIEGNSFYQQTVLTLPTPLPSAEDYQIMALENGRHTVRGNYIGGSAPKAGGTAFNLSLTPDNLGFKETLSCITVTYALCTIENNVLTNFNLGTAGFNGIYVYGSAAGTAEWIKIRNNTFGHAQSDSTIACTGNINGMLLQNVFSKDSTEITGNQLTGIIASGHFRNSNITYGISVISSHAKIKNNVIRGFKSLPVSGTQSRINGIRFMQQPNNDVVFDSISGNEISDFSIALAGAGQSSITGIDFSMASNMGKAICVVVNNTVRNLNLLNITNDASISGIIANGRQMEVDSNRVYSLGISNPSGTPFATPAAIAGITMDFYVPGGLCSNNLVHDLSITNSASNADITGIYANMKGITVANNLVGINDISAARITGINAASVSGKVVHNTVRIAGTNDNGDARTSCLTSAFASGVPGFTSIIRSNIFSNTRINGEATGLNAAISLSAVPDVIDYNDYYFDANAAMPLGFFIDTIKSGLSAWRVATRQDCHSVTLNPQITNSDMSNAAGYYPNEQKLRAAVEIDVTEDYFGTARSTTTPAMGAVERNTTVLDNSTATITAISPIPVAIGGLLQIKGTNFIGVSSVKMNGAPASFTVISEDSITAVVPVCARGGNTVTVTTLCSEAQSNSLQVIDSCVVPQIDSISPDPAGFNSWVRLYGNALDRITSATINGVQVDSIDLESCLSIRVLLPFTATSGNLIVTSICGSDSMALTVETPVPDICCASFKSSCGGSGFDLANFVDNNIAAGKVPSGAVLTWHTDPIATSANKLANTTSVSNGVYYAAYYIAAKNYYSPTFINADGSGSTVSSLCISLDIECPNSTFNADPDDGFSFTPEQQAIIDEVYTSFSGSCGCDTDPSYLYWFSSTSPNFYTNTINNLKALNPGIYYLYHVGWGGYYETFYSDPIVVTINPCGINVTTVAADSVSSTAGTIRGTVSGNSSGTAVRGFVYSSVDNTPTIGETDVTKVNVGTGNGTYRNRLTGLTPGTTYYYRAFVTETSTTTYGSVLNFTPACSPQYEDNLGINGDVVVITMGADSAYLNTAAICRNIALIKPSGGLPVNGTVTGKVWVFDTAPYHVGAPYAGRSFEITPSVNSSTATATITLFFTQKDFDVFNSVPNGDDFPYNPADAEGNKANIRIYKFGGTSSDGSGRPSTYDQPGEMIDPDDDKIVWNEGLQRWEITFNTIGFSGFFAGNQSGALLPIVLKNFSGKAVKEDNLLNWNTAEESNALGFEVERSLDGRNFTIAGKVAAKGSNSAYAFTDSKVSGVFHYYRLKLVDKDGTSRYSEVITISRRDNKTLSMALYPNPAKTAVMLNTSAKQGTVRIYNMEGRVLQTTNWQQGAALSIGKLPAGHYVVELTTAEGTTREKLWKQ